MTPDTTPLQTPRLWQVVLPSPPFTTLTYAVPHWWPDALLAPGVRALAPLGRGNRTVVLHSAVDAPPDGVALKELLWPLDEWPRNDGHAGTILLDPGYMRLLEDLAVRTGEPLGVVLYAVLPKGVRAGAVNLRVADPGFARRITAPQLARMDASERARLAQVGRGGRVQVLTTTERENDWCALAVDPPWDVRPTARRQREILDRLYDGGSASRRALLGELGAGAAAPLNTLIKHGLVRMGPMPDDAVLSLGGVDEQQEADPDALQMQLTPGQQDTMAALRADMDATFAGHGPRARLVHGITGSGKTLVYLLAARHALQAGRTVILLAPEVALAVSLYRAAKQALGSAVVRLYHGYQSPTKRERTFREFAEARTNGAGTETGTGAALGPRVLVGTRSALFVPLALPGLVIVDEEHDESYKQDERFTYQAKEVAWARVSGGAEGLAGVLVLGSATPDVKTSHAAEAGRLPRSIMGERVGAGGMPPVTVVPAPGSGDGGGGTDGPLSTESREALLEAVNAGEQAIVMLNRRGYAPLIYCLTCEEPVRCQRCHVSLTYHKAREKLVCHWCGGSHDFPMRCSGCGQTHYIPLGGGTEQLEEQVIDVLPDDCSVLRLDRDATRRQERLERILSDFSAGRAQVLVGTQMLSKGHHFPGVTCVVVLEGDLGLNLPDYRARERTFQLLTQVAGRAGRGDAPGRVFVQSRNPADPFWKHVQAGDYEGFFADEVSRRQTFGYPPFSHLALIRLSFDEREEGGPQVLAAVRELLAREAPRMGATVLGPAPAPVPRVRGRMRHNALVKASDWSHVRGLFDAVRRLLESRSAAAPSMRARLDLDPMSML